MTPIWIAWRVSEKAPEITACEAITVATVASAISGYSAQSGASSKKGCLTGSGELRISAPCPK